MDRLLNYIFLLLLIYVFALWTSPLVNGAIIIGVFISIVFCSTAFVLGWLTLNGAAAATVIGSIAFGLGGWPTAIALLCFFMSSALISKHTVTDEVAGEPPSVDFVRRNGLQVWANGFWLAVWLLLGVLTNLNICWLAGMAAISTATADTWATELGSSRFNATTYLAGTFEPVTAGSEGGMSLPGTAASVVGSALIAGIATLGFSTGPGWFFCVFIAGALGAFVDSLIGSRFQGEELLLKMPFIPREYNIYIDNNLVNWISTGLGSLIALLLGQFIL